MKKNILNLYEGFFDDLDKLNQDDGFRGTNDQVYDEHDYILSQDRNPEFFKGLCDMFKFYNISYNENGFIQEYLDQIISLTLYSNKEPYVIGPDFNYFNKSLKKLNELKYFNKLKKLDDYFFKNCEKLKFIEFPENLKYIGQECFYNCSLTSLVFPKNLEKIDSRAFEYCQRLKTIKFNENIKEISEFAFAYERKARIPIPYSGGMKALK